jgi:predicted alpha/beta hydrolase family esterase
MVASASSLIAAAAGLLALLGLGVLSYLLGSFLLMQAHVERRPLGETAADVFQELLWIVLVQPLLPLFYFVGRRMGGRDGGVPVVFVHGYMQNRVGFLGLARALARRGMGPLYGFNYPFFAPVLSNAERLTRFVDRVRAETGAPQVDLVCHSMGGLVALACARRAGVGPLRRVVTIASPHAGVAFRGPIPFASGRDLRRGAAVLVDLAAEKLPLPTLSIFSLQDNVVHPSTTSSLAARGGRDVPLTRGSHLSILFRDDVAEHVAGFLQAPEEVLAPEEHDVALTALGRGGRARRSDRRGGGA